MTTRTLAGTAAALLAAAGLCRGAASDNQVQPTSPIVVGKNPSTIPSANNAAPAPVGSDWEEMAKAFGGSKADTKPSRDVVMQFTFATEVREINVVGGQKVEKGKVLMRARDADVVAGIASQRDMAENEYEIRGAEKQEALARFKFDRIKGSGTYAPYEYEEAKIAAEVAVVQFDAAKRRKLQEGLRLKTAEAQYLRYWLEAPFDGIVEEVMVEVGEGVTEQTKVMRMVNTDKLWLDPYASTTETIKLAIKEGSPAWVLIDMPDAPKLVRGRVLYVSPVADSVSQTRRVRVEIDNPQQWPAGTQARVRFTEPSGEWEKYKVAALMGERSVGRGSNDGPALAIEAASVLAKPAPQAAEVDPSRFVALQWNPQTPVKQRWLDEPEEWEYAHRRFVEPIVFSRPLNKPLMLSLQIESRPSRRAYDLASGVFVLGEPVAGAGVQPK